MTEPLALKYRPRTFTDLVGQPAVQVILQQMVKTDQVPHALLFEGCRGTGKTTTARILAAALNCEQASHPVFTSLDKTATKDSAGPCGTCVSCKATFDGSSLDVLEIDAASNGLVDDIRALRQSVRYRQGGNYRIVILDEAQSISPAGFNALLKTLEEPPPNTVFLLLTTETAKILPTVASRCTAFNFKRLSVHDIANRLAHIAIAEGYAVQDDLLLLIAERADGAMRDAIMLLEQVARIGMTTAEQYQRLIGHVDHAPAILDRLVHGDIPGAFEALDRALTRVADAAVIADATVSLLRDVLVLRCGGEVHKTGNALAVRQSLALTLETPVCLTALKILWQVKTQLRTDNPRSTLELAVAMLSEVIHTAPQPPARMTLNDLGKRP